MGFPFACVLHTVCGFAQGPREVTPSDLAHQLPQMVKYIRIRADAHWGQTTALVTLGIIFPCMYFRAIGRAVAVAATWCCQCPMQHAMTDSSPPNTVRPSRQHALLIITPLSHSGVMSFLVIYPEWEAWNLGAQGLSKDLTPSPSIHAALRANYSIPISQLPPRVRRCTPDWALGHDLKACLQ